MQQPICMEIVKWKAKKSVSDSDMIQAVKDMVPDLKKCNGFFHQSLSRNEGGEWVEVYYWKDESCAHASNEYMAVKKTFLALMGLVNAESVSIEVMAALQMSSDIKFE